MKKRIVVMLLAGGQGSRLGVLTSNMAKPAVPFGGKYRIIDFPLSMWPSPVKAREPYRVTRYASAPG